MRLLPKHIWKEEFQYHSYKSVDDLKFEIQQLFDQSEGYNDPRAKALEPNAKTGDFFCKLTVMKKMK